MKSGIIRMVKDLGFKKNNAVFYDLYEIETKRGALALAIHGNGVTILKPNKGHKTIAGTMPQMKAVITQTIEANNA